MADKNLADVTGPTIPEDNEIDVAVGTFTDDDGKPAQVDGPPVWTPGSNCTVTASEDGLTGTLTPTDAASSGDSMDATVSVPSEGDNVIQKVIVPLGAGEINALGLSFGTPRKKGTTPVEPPTVRKGGSKHGKHGK